MKKYIYPATIIICTLILSISYLIVNLNQENPKILPAPIEPIAINEPQTETNIKSPEIKPVKISQPIEPKIPSVPTIDNETILRNYKTAANEEWPFLITILQQVLQNPEFCKHVGTNTLTDIFQGIKKLDTEYGKYRASITYINGNMQSFYDSYYQLVNICVGPVIPLVNPS